MHLTLSSCAVRSWRASDLDSLVTYANNHKIWINLRDAFPHPYTRKDGRAFIRRALGQSPQTMFAIATGDEADEAVGGIGYSPHQDVERVSAEIGYWLAEPFWGRGIMSEALAAVTAHAIKTHHLTRLYAVPFAWNPASCRVLEKAGYVLEARLRHSAMKNGQLIDQLQYAYVAE